MKKLLCLFAVMLLGIALLPACSKNDDKGKPLVVACEASSSPYCYYVSDAKPPVAGIDIDLIEEIGKALGRPVQYKIVPFQQVFTFVSMGKADIGAAGITITPQRAERVLFSTVYDVSSQVIVVPKNSAIMDETMLKSARVAAQEGTSDLDLLRERIKPRTVPPFLTQEEVNFALSVRRADAAVMDLMQAELLVKATGDEFRINQKPLSKEQYGLIFNKENTALAEAANTVIDRFKLSGELQKSREKHLEELKSHPGSGAKPTDTVKPFVVCLDPSFAPFAFMDNNRLSGVDIEMSQAIADELKRPLQIRIVPFAEILSLVMSGTADMGTSGISITPERAESVLYSTPYETNVRRILVREDSPIERLADLEGKRIGAEKGTTNEDFAANTLIAKETIHCDNATEGIIKLLNQEIDAYIDDESEADLAAGKYVGRIRMLNIAIPAEEYGFVFRHGNSEAKNAADKVIATKHANGDLQALFRKYNSIYKTVESNGI